MESESSVVVKSVEGKGRGVVSTKPLKAGHIILRDSPILLYSAIPFSFFPKNPNLYCSNCFRTILNPSSKLLLFLSCPSCGGDDNHHNNVLFCSPNCQSVALSSSGSHSPWVCQTQVQVRLLLQNPNPQSLFHPDHPDLQVQVRFLIAAYNLSPEKLHTLLSLHGQPSPLDFSAAQFFHSIFLHIEHFPPNYANANANGLSFSVHLSASLLAKDKHNAFGLMEPPPPPNTDGNTDGNTDDNTEDGNTEDGNTDDAAASRSSVVRAYGIYPNASLFNHDCLPNACRFDYLDSSNDTNNTDLIFRLIHDVPQAREICLSYFPVNLNYSNRQKRLFDDYGFICHCDRCQIESNWDKDDQEDDQDDSMMDEDQQQDDQMSAENETEIAEEDDDFPHSYFFLRFVCNRDNCWGTLAPLPPSLTDASPSQFLECNVCGNFTKDDDFADEH